MGVVYRARRLGEDVDVALKLIRPDKMSSLCRRHRQQLLERFAIQARAAAQLDHPRIAAVRAIGDVEGTPYYVMRYVQGRTLARVVRDQAVTQHEAARLIDLTAEAIQYSHEQGVLHCDLKPHNIIRDEESGAPVISDFGLAKFLTRNTRDPVADLGVGTPGYMAPEQFRSGGSVSMLSDVYALGATLYHLLTGRPPFSAESLGETIRRILAVESVPPRSLSPTIDPGLEQICLKCLRKEPERRYASAGDLSVELRRWSERMSFAAPQIKGLSWCPHPQSEAVSEIPAHESSDSWMEEQSLWDKRFRPASGFRPLAGAALKVIEASGLDSLSA